MEQQVALPLYYYPPGLNLSEVRTAFEQLGLGVRVQPYSADTTPYNRVLAVGAKPDWLCDYVYVDSPTSPRFEMAVKWALGLIELENGPNLIVNQLSKAFGGEVIEVGNTQ